MFLLKETNYNKHDFEKCLLLDEKNSVLSFVAHVARTLSVFMTDDCHYNNDKSSNSLGII